MNKQFETPSVFAIPLTQAQPDDLRELLILVEYEDGEPLSTWYGYRKDNKYFGITIDGAGWQEMGGNVVGWLYLPMFSLATVSA